MSDRDEAAEEQADEERRNEEEQQEHDDLYGTDEENAIDLLPINTGD